MPLLILDPTGADRVRRAKIKTGRGRRNRRWGRRGPGTPPNDAVYRWYERKFRRSLSKYFAAAAKQARADRLNGKTLSAIRERLDALIIDLEAQITEGAVPDIEAAYRKVDAYTRERFQYAIRETCGVDAISVLSPVIEDEERRKLIAANVELIKDELHSYNREIYAAVVEDYLGQGFSDGSKSLTERIQNVTGHSFKHAKLIARDQMAKLNSTLAQARQEDAGVTHYVWRTAKDQRVVGNPAGLYPRVSDPAVHGNHYHREGKVFAWNDPPPDGHPGHGIQCRCYAAPILDMEELKFIQPM